MSSGLEEGVQYRDRGVGHSKNRRHVIEARMLLCVKPLRHTYQEDSSVLQTAESGGQQVGELDAEHSSHK